MALASQSTGSEGKTSPEPLAWGSYGLASILPSALCDPILCFLLLLWSSSPIVPACDFYFLLSLAREVFLLLHWAAFHFLLFP
jgi:hypothetical protein